jgi:hypothetical protein
MRFVKILAEPILAVCCAYAITLIVFWGSEWTYNALKSEPLPPEPISDSQRMADSLWWDSANLADSVYNNPDWEPDPRWDNDEW